MAGAAAVRPMTAAEFADWWRTEVDGYGAELAAASGEDLEHARRRAAQQTHDLLPDGMATPGHRLLRVLDGEGEAVGVLWVGPHPQQPDAGWVYDVEIHEDRRGEGLGRAAMLAAEQVCREAGWSALGLNVFGPNTRARGLYDSLGYEAVSTHMRKPLG